MTNQPKKRHRRWHENQQSDQDGEASVDHHAADEDVVYTVRIQPGPDEETKFTDEKSFRRQQLNISRGANWIAAVGAGTAFLALLALGYNAKLIHDQWAAMVKSNEINKSAFDRAYRPYVGINTIACTYGAKNIKFTPAPMPDTDAMDFRVDLKNFGPVPAANFISDWQVFVDNKPVHMDSIPDTPKTLFPDQTLGLDGIVGFEQYKNIQNGSAILTFKLVIDYDSPQGHQKYCSEDRYMPLRYGFISLGNSCS